MIPSPQDADASISIPGKPGIDGADDPSHIFDAKPEAWRHSENGTNGRRQRPLVFVHGPPDRLTPREVDWFDGLVEGDRAFTVLPADLCVVDPDAGETSAGHRFRDPQEAAARVADLMIAHGLAGAPTDRLDLSPARPPPRWGRALGRRLARRLSTLMRRGIRQPAAGSGWSDRGAAPARRPDRQALSRPYTSSMRTMSSSPV
jgi:hypothetical protein